jgi:UDP-N-acetyl-D-glucosamine dehydrogenase
MAVTVVLGQGYVGLPLAQALTEVGDEVFGFDVNEKLVAELNSGKSRIDDISDEDLSVMLAAGYKATTNPVDIAKADNIVICVPTPLGEAGGPDMSYVESASNLVAENMKPGALVVLESTTYPGTTSNFLKPIIEAKGFALDDTYHLAFSPERIDPGNAHFNIRNTPKIVGGESAESGDRAFDFYDRFVEKVVRTTGTKEAETAKLLENTYRHVNIALINELATYCHSLGIDIWEVVKAASSKPYGFQAFYPGPGVGGHCIPVDPAYLSYEVKRTLGADFRFIEAAMDINRSMPNYVVSRVRDLLTKQGKQLKGAKVLLLGMTYKPDIADLRESPSLDVFEILLEEQTEVAFFDPHVNSLRAAGSVHERAADLNAALADADVAILLQAHKAFDLGEIASRTKVLFDTRGVASGASVVRL